MQTADCEEPSDLADDTQGAMVSTLFGKNDRIFEDFRQTWCEARNVQRANRVYKSGHTVEFYVAETMLFGQPAIIKKRTDAAEDDDWSVEHTAECAMFDWRAGPTPKPVDFPRPASIDTPEAPTYCTTCDDSGEIPERDCYSADGMEILNTEWSRCEECPECEHCGLLMRESPGAGAEIYEGEWVCSPRCAALWIGVSKTLASCTYDGIHTATGLLIDHDDSPPATRLCILRAISLMAQSMAQAIEVTS